MTTTVLSSVTRISDLDSGAYDIDALDKSAWATGDYVVCEVTGKPTRLYHIETSEGDMTPVVAGDRVIGALGDRAATLEGVGSWRDVRDGHMSAMTSAGLFGHLSSISALLPRTMSLDYVGHVVRSGSKVRMRDFALRDTEPPFATPTLLLVGTSMSAGKTETGKLACRLFAESGRKVMGAKLTGAGRYRDILSFRTAGAAEICDFVDVGLPSTVVPEDEFRAAIRPLLSHIQSRDPDVLVAEAGASPLEPYNGDAAIDELGDNIRCTVLCASDPYAVVGVQKAFGLTPDLVTGPATNTSAAVALVEKLTGVRGINIIDPACEDEFRDFLFGRFGA